ncbi:sigma-70 family RNA polymerase sigma factor [Paenibacillus pasadenensis]|uniref:sigma-70 family RNA polymerase sigma factor n=1 Tax=Paenibacillus pasadenensis TaxID=217090 RepID=UPI00203AF4BA|nr:sigma-70 family RNA polymerase sigma factor [Paenibacillus pasadenensis]MCM3747560.1 sigma-70 family RNA polymerase sigma factor [Paenibacillus pasadenensis]
MKLRKDDGAEQKRLEQLYRDERATVFQAAYRMLGSIADAEDVTQELFADLQTNGLPELRSSRAYLVRAAVNRSLNLLSSARRRRERYVGEWLPEPLPDFPQQELGPEQLAELHDELRYGFLTLLEKLTPSERAVVVLHEGYGYDYESIAGMLGKSSAACRQYGSRAKRKLQQARGGDSIGNEEPENSTEALPATKEPESSRKQVLERFVSAFENFRIEELQRLLSEDVVMITDGGGKVHAAIRPIFGRQRIVAFLSSPKAFQGLRQLLKQSVVLNGEQQLLVYDDNGTVQAAVCFELDAAGTGVRRIYLIRNPDKLSHLQPQLLL